MANDTNVSQIQPAAFKSRLKYNFPKAIDKALTEYEWRIVEVRAILRLLEQHVTAPPDGKLDEGIVSGAVDAAIRVLKPIQSLYEPHELERIGMALIAAEVANG